ncbi:hypothetical protein VIGAN_05280700, partial [Vigna angularis var. angularis]
LKGTLHSSLKQNFHSYETCFEICQTLKMTCGREGQMSQIKEIEHFIELSKPQLISFSQNLYLSKTQVSSFLLLLSRNSSSHFIFSII